MIGNANGFCLRDLSHLKDAYLICYILWTSWITSNNKLRWDILAARCHVLKKKIIKLAVLLELPELLTEFLFSSESPVQCVSFWLKHITLIFWPPESKVISTRKQKIPKKKKKETKKKRIGLTTLENYRMKKKKGITIKKNSHNQQWNSRRYSGRKLSTIPFFFTGLVLNQVHV